MRSEWQIYVVIVILAAAVGYGAYRVFQTFRHRDNLCEGCSGCDLKRQICDKKREKACCCHKN